MNCKYHSSQEAQSICEKCKQPICPDCTIEVDNKTVCRHCVQQNLFSELPVSLKSSSSEKFVFFCFSLIPGAAHMHMGLFRRGLQLMIITFGGVSLNSFIGLDFLIPLVLIPAWFFSFFESYHLRRQLENGHVINDEDLLNRQLLDYTPLLKNRRLIGFTIIVVGFFSFMHQMEQYLFSFFGEWNRYYYMLRSSLIPLALVLAGIYLIVKAKQPTKVISDISENK